MQFREKTYGNRCSQTILRDCFCNNEPYFPTTFDKNCNQDGDLYQYVNVCKSLKG